MTKVIKITTPSQLENIDLSNYEVKEDTDIHISMKLHDYSLEKPITILQQNENTNFNLDIKIALFGKSKLKIPVELFVKKGAVDTKTYFNGLVYLMDQKSSAYIVPSLYIHEKNIDGASHGVVIKNIKDTDLIYFYSRGINNQEAKRLLTNF